MTRIKQITIFIAFIFLCKMAFGINSPKNMYFKKKIGPLDSKIVFAKKQSVSKKVVEQIFEKFKKKMNLHKKKNFRDIILVATKNLTAYIYDLKNRKLIYKFKPSNYTWQNQKIYPFEINERDGKIYLKFNCQLKGQYVNILNSIRITRDDYINEIDILNQEVAKEKEFNEGRKQILRPFFGYVEKEDEETDYRELKHDSYELMFNKKNVVIARDNLRKKTGIHKEKQDIKSVCINPKKGSRYILVESHNPNCVELYNHRTGKGIVRIKTKNKKLKHAIFSKKHNFILMLFNNYVLILDLNKMKVVFKQAFKSLGDKNKNDTKSIFLSSDEKEFWVSHGKYFYIFHNPVVKKLEFKQKLLDKTFKHKAYTDVKISFQD
ncbi:hypothetical protein ACFLYU_05645 [Candidatus Dependentiae bacterium]